jgi:hypothetical protein
MINQRNYLKNIILSFQFIVIIVIDILILMNNDNIKIFKNLQKSSKLK